ncbi:XRE family transcriptional regulator [Longimycelium tulufanense]|uniref:XRE family transcriptional regulator n=1 Tax=Longimycelium tulufanense TaxID=907463 RepID=A0A8J3CHA6_9PSEU|nr:helix-turn-helix domain-containing protein [Longimycelium tulufanense]GGM61091.1 XRE family transcriptional regulator [Longimycelium tulufanense]
MAERRTLAQKLDHLLRVVHPAGRGPYTHEEVAQAIKARGGPTISAAYLWQLRKGLRDNPTKNHLEALAGFFGVPVAYFFDDEQARIVDEEIEFLQAMRDAEVRDVALRTMRLSPEARRSVAAIIAELGRYENRSDRRRRTGEEERGDS